MTKFTRFSTVLLITISLSTFSGFAQSSAESNTSLVDQLTEQMALKHQLGEAPEDIQVQFAQNPLQLPAEKNEQMLDLFEEAYSAELLLADFKSAFRNEMDNQYKKEISQWLNDESTQTVTDARQEFYTLQGKRKRVITMHEMEQDTPTAQRTELIATLTDTTTIAESSVESSVIILRSVIEALGQLSEQRSFSEAQINGIADNFRSQMQAQANQQLNNQSMIMYYNVPADALKNYISFWGTETGQWLDRAISQSMQAAYKAGAQRFLKSIENTQ